MHTLRKLSLYIVLFLSSIQIAQAGREPEIKQVLPRSGVTFAVNNTAVTYDAVLLQSNGIPTGISPSMYNLFNVKNMVYLDIDQSQINHFYITQFSVSVDIEINSKNENGTPNPTQYKTLTIDYDSSTLYRYTEKNSFTFANAYWVEAKITGINNTAAIPYIRLNNTMTIERYKPLAMITPVFNNALILSASDDIEVNWNTIDGAEEYDLEWTFVDDYNDPALNSGGSYPNPYLLSSDIDYSFTNNATRVTIKGTSYKVPVIAEHGYLLFRVRAVGYIGTNFTHRKEGLWSSNNYGPKIQNTTGSSFTMGNDLFHFVHSGTSPGMLLVHEKSLNWQCQTVFAEEGKNKSVIGYYDGALKNRQNVTRISTDEMAVAAEDIYDHQGRKAGSFLPAPTYENKLKFYANFNLSAATNNPYSESDFDLSSNHCVRNIGQASISNGAGKYYSINNPNSGNMHYEYLPDAQQYPFVLTEYMPDGTGRVRRQGGVGPTHQIGSGHETKYFYGTPDAEELDRLFGNSAGNAEHYQKNIIIDPNGQVSVSYLDLQGRVIATALAGDNPSNMQGLPHKGNPSTLDVEIKINKQSDLYDKRIETMKTVVVAQPGNYIFDYSITIPRLSDANTPNLCFDCIYQMDIELIDECGTNILDGDVNTPGVQKLTRSIGKPQANYDIACEGNAVEYNFINDQLLGNNSITSNLQIGSYSLVKTLRVDEAALEYYTAQYIAANSELKTFEDFKEEYEQTADFGQCEITCTKCLNKLGTYPTFLNAELQNIINAGGTPNGLDTSIILKTFEALEDHCSKLCNTNNTNRCEDLLAILKTDISPGGQYAPVLDDNSIGGILNTELSAISSLGFNYQYHWENTGDINDRQPIIYTKSNNDPILINVQGVNKTPNELTPKEFETYFNEDLASVLVKYHPEYCKYEQCISNQAAEDYEQAMLKTETYSQALTAGYMNPVNEISAPCAANNLDPWFQNGGNGQAKLQDMKNLLSEYNSLDPSKPECVELSVWQLCQAYYVCGQKECTQINTCLSNTPWGSVNCTPYLDQMWRMFRAIYLAERRKMIEEQLAGSCPRSAALNGKIERIPALSNVSGSFSADEFYTIKQENKQRLLSECDTACMSKAQNWYLQFLGCNLSATDSAELISNFIKVCRNACDEKHPFGASSSPKNRAQRIATPFYSFRDVFNKMVSQGKIIPKSGKCDINLVTEMPYNHNFDKHPSLEGDTACIKNYNELDPCVKNAPTLELKRLYQKTNPPNDTNFCEKCIKCSDLKDALLEIQMEYGIILPDSTIGWRTAITNRLNQLLNFNLYWQDYWDFMKNCSDVDSTFSQSIINHFMLYYTGIDVPERMHRYDEILRDSDPYLPVPVNEFYFASLQAAPLTVPSTDSTILSTCICNKLATLKTNWLNNNNGYPTFNDFMAYQCGFNPGQNFDFEAILGTCRDMYNLRGKLNNLPGTWSNNQKNTFNNFVLSRNIYVPKLCTWDCQDTPITEKNPFLNKGKFGNTNNPPPGYTPGTKPNFRKGVSCDSFWNLIDSMQAVLGSGFNIRTVLRMNLFNGNTIAIQANLSAFLQVKNAFYAKYTQEVEDTRFGDNALKAVLAWLQKYKHCIMDEMGYDADGVSCCYKPNRYARALNTLLNKMSEPIDQYGNWLIEDNWNMHPPIPEFYSSVLYTGTNKTTIKYLQNPYDIPSLVMDLDDMNGVKRTVQLNYVDNLYNEAYYGDIVAFMHLQPVRLNGPCDTAHYFKVKAVQKVSWGYDTTWLTGYAPHWNLMDTCDKTQQIELCDKNYYELPWEVDTLTCSDRISMLVNYHALRAFDEYMVNVKNDFRKRYMDKCLDPLLTENFKITKPIFEYHYTLYYYDQAGNLLQTVPPAGVNPLSNAQLAAVKSARINNTTGIFPAHTLNTRYKYNTLNQLIWQQTPDAGASEFWYDNVGRLVISQNAKQTQAGHYSYTQFDALGRITEVGQLENISGAGPMSWTIAFNPTLLANFISSGNHKQVTKTYYDETTPGFTFMSQENLRKRVSGMEYFDDASGTVVSGVYYTYDIHGNVPSLVRRNEALNSIGMAYTRTDYSFDLVSGKVNRVDYQKNQSDWFMHKYEYDADNRITDVFTSDNNTFYDRDASYFYYLHGPMKRVELGEMKVQGLDYIYTIHGWIKGVNSSTLQAYRDPGKDGLAGNMHQNVCRDVAGFNLGYYEGEYKAIGSNTGGTINNSNNFTPSTTGSSLDNAAPNLYNGNIRHMITALKPFMYNKSTNTWSSPQAMAYNYDQLNRITSSQAFASGNVQTTNDWGGAMSKQEYLENYTYDPNGNMLTLYRNGHNAGLPQMDQFTYSYRSGTNQLDHVSDAVNAGNYSTDIDNQNLGNYDYDAIGNLIKDDAEEIASIEWTVYGKISKVIRTAISTKPDLEFTYSPEGHRISKKVIGKGATPIISYTYYSLDAQGNHTATYQYRNDSFVWETSPIYGNARVGVFEAQKLIVHNGLPVTPGLAAGYSVAIRGVRRYEISNHLGNVLTTISDRRGMICDSNGIIHFYEAEIVTASDYYPFGSLMQGRQFSVGGGYKYGFNGKEKDTDIADDNYDFGARIYDARIGRWLAVDPLFRKFVSTSGYSYALNCPLIFVDYDGRDIVCKSTAVCTGPAVPTCTGEIANTGGTMKFVKNEKTNQYDFCLNLVVTYSSSYEKICKRNGPGFDEYVVVHETEHVNRYIQAAEENYTINLIVEGESKSYSGQLDKIMTAVWCDIDTKMSEVNKDYENQLSQLISNEINELQGIAVGSLEYDRISKEFAEARTNLIQSKKAKEKSLNENLNSAADALYDAYIMKADDLNQHVGDVDGVMNASESKMSNNARKFSQGVKPVKGANKEELDNCDDKGIIEIEK